MKQDLSESKQDLKEAKEVMEDEGGANQAGLKQQQAKQSFANPNKTDTYDQPGENAEANEMTGRTGPIDDVKREKSAVPGENVCTNPQPPYSKSGK